MLTFHSFQFVGHDSRGGKEARRTIGKVSFSSPWRIKRKFPHRYLERVARVFESQGGGNFRTVR